jgi:lysyl-tRNA synthetase class 1
MQKTNIWEKFIVQNFRDKQNIILQGGFTPSGPRHLGVFREGLTLFFLKKAAEKVGKVAKIIYLIDDHDPFRGKQTKYKQWVGFQLYEIPFTTGQTYAEYFLDIIFNQLKKFKIYNDFFFIKVSELYKQARFTQYYNRIATKFHEILKLLPTPKDNKEQKSLFYFFSAKCTLCKRIDNSTTINLNSQEVQFICCEKEQSVPHTAPAGSGKIKYRYEWPLKWEFFQTDLEPSGKDHSFGTGAQVLAKKARKILGYKIPQGFPYEFIYVNSEVPHKSKNEEGLLELILEKITPTLYKYLVFITRPTSIIDAPQQYELISSTYTKFENQYSADPNFFEIFISPEEGRRLTNKYLSYQHLRYLFQYFRDLNINTYLSFLDIRNLDSSRIILLEEKLQSIASFIEPYTFNRAYFKLRKNTRDPVKYLLEKYQTYENVYQAIFGVKHGPNLRKFCKFKQI